MFFSLSGALQTLGLHESDGGGPPPPAWIAWMADVHQHQRMFGDGPGAADHDGPGGGPGAAARDNRDEVHHEGQIHGGPSSASLKAFTLLLAFGLIASSIMGMAIALSATATRRSGLLAISLGVMVPLLLGTL